MCTLYIISFFVRGDRTATVQALLLLYVHATYIAHVAVTVADVRAIAHNLAADAGEMATDVIDLRIPGRTKGSSKLRKIEDGL